MPLLAARPGLKLLFIEPNDSRKPDRLRSGKPQRPDHLLRAQVEQLSRSGGRPEYAASAGDVPARVIVVWIDGVADLHSVSTPRTRALRKSLPETGCISQIARMAEATGPAG